MDNMVLSAWFCVSACLIMTIGVLIPGGGATTGGPINGRQEMSHVVDALKCTNRFNSYLNFLNACVTNSPSLALVLPQIISISHTGTTMLVPDDKAFNVTIIPALIAQLEAGNLPSLLEYSILPQRFEYADFQGHSDGRTYDTVEGTQMRKYLDNNNKGVVVLGPMNSSPSQQTTITTPNIYKDGVIAVHGVSNLLIPTHLAA